LRSLFLHDDAKADLYALRAESPEAAGRIVALLQELESNPDLQERLTEHDFGARGRDQFHVSKWQAQWRAGKDLWRLKLWDLEQNGLPYRIVYAFVPIRRHHHILAVVPRSSFNYDDRDPVTQRILRAYEGL
jgi:hypothetical protein